MKKIFLGILNLLGAVFAILLITYMVMVNKPMPALPEVASNNQPVLIQNGNIVDVENDLIVKGDILIRNGIIESIQTDQNIKNPEDAQIIDASGKYLIPALWDMHVHIGTDKAQWIDFPAYIANGVTNIREMGGLGTERYEDWAPKIETSKLLGPRIQSYSAAFVPNLRDSAHAESVVSGIDKTESVHIKVYNSVLEEHLAYLIDLASERDIEVLGHKPRAISAINASNLGMESIEHARLFLFESFPGTDEFIQKYRYRITGEQEVNEQLNSVERLQQMVDEFDENRFYTLVDTMIKNETWYVPTHITRRFEAFAFDEAYITDERLKYIPWIQQKNWLRDAAGMAAFTSGDSVLIDFYEAGLPLSKKGMDRGLMILAGTDANDSFCFPGFSMHDELYELVKGGMTSAEALQTATINPARYYGLHKSHGSVAEGKVADLLILDENPLADIQNTTSINTVIYNGGIYDKSKINELTHFVERNASRWSVNLQMLVE